MTKIMQIHNLSALNRRQLQNVRDKIGCLFKVVVSYLIVGNSMSSEWITSFTLWSTIFFRK